MSRSVRASALLVAVFASFFLCVSQSAASIQITESTPVNWAFDGNGNFTNADLQAFFNIASPVMGVTVVNGFLYVDSDPDNSTYDLDGDSLVNLYKENAGASGEEVRPFKDSYDSSFFDGAEWATIEYTGGPKIALEHVFLIVKDGNAYPNVYVYDLNSLGWDGEESIQLGSADDPLFDAQGSISHVEIVGGGLEREEGNEIPEPISLAVWGGLGLAGLGAVYARRRS